MLNLQDLSILMFEFIDILKLLVKINFVFHFILLFHFYKTDNARSFLIKKIICQFKVQAKLIEF